MDNGIGNKIYHLRKAKNITQMQLAEFLYVTPQTVSKWESGNGTPDISLIPKIATFFDVSLDYLFNVADSQRVKTLILKYSVLKDDYSFSQALSMIDSVLDDETISTEAKKEYLSLKGHLFLQKGRDSIDKALDATNQALELSEDQDRMPLLLQTYLLRAMNGDYDAIRSESRHSFESNPSADTLYTYLETLTILKDFEEICNLIKNNKNAINLCQDKSKTTHIWIQYFRALTELSKEKEAKLLYEELIQTVSEQEKFAILMLYAKMLSKLGKADELNAIKDQALNILDFLDYNEYIRREIRAQIEEL